MKVFQFILISIFLVAATTTEAREVKITFVQANDVYEIVPVSGGEFGGLARVQTLVDTIKIENPNTFTALAGDYLNPSALGAAKIDGHPIGGEHIVDVLNHMQWDFITIGNHEFDRGVDFQARMLQTESTVLSSNVFRADGEPYEGTEDIALIEVDGIQLGVFGIMLRYDQGKSGRSYKTTDQFEAAREAVETLESLGADVIVAMTHQSIEEDTALADMGLNIDLIIGGHEHENVYMRRGPNLTPIAKADANARSVYIHNIIVDVHEGDNWVSSKLVPITASIPSDPAIETVANAWLQRAYDAYRADGIEPLEMVAMSDERLIGLESAVRTKQTNLGHYVAQSAFDAFDDVEFALVNGGSIRIDDILPPGEIRVWDVLRVLPFGGTYSVMDIKGESLLTLLEQGQSQSGVGSYLQRFNIDRTDTGWLINGEPIEVERIYRGAISTYILENGDQGLHILREQTGITKIARTPVDAQLALISTLNSVFPPTE